MDKNFEFENFFGNIFDLANAQGIDAIAAPTLPVDPSLSGPIFGESNISEITPAITAIITVNPTNTQRLIPVDTPTPTQIPTQTVIPTVIEIPNSDLSSFSSYIPSVIGIALLITGIFLSRLKKVE